MQNIMTLIQISITSRKVYIMILHLLDVSAFFDLDLNKKKSSICLCMCINILAIIAIALIFQLLYTYSLHQKSVIEYRIK